LDTSFGAGGIVITAVSGLSDHAYSVAIQADGRIVAAGVTGVSSNFALVRYNADGSLDASFGSSGIVVTSPAPGKWNAESLAIQGNGRIVAGGSDNSGIGGLIRLMPDGTLDPTFDGDGKVTMAKGVSAIAIQSDGKILAAGGHEDVMLTRYLPNGALDPSFGSNGVVTTAVGPSNDQAYEVLIQPDGLILAGGYRHDEVAGDDFMLARYLPDGSLDSSFGTGGVVISDVGDEGAWVQGIGLQSDGKILAAGHSSGSGTGRIVVARYDTAGNLDPTYGEKGIVKTYIDQEAEPSGAAMQSDDNLVVAGTLSKPGEDPSEILVVRYVGGGCLCH